MMLSKIEEEQLYIMISRAVENFLGRDVPELSKSALGSILKGYDRKKTERKIGKYLEGKKVARFTDRLYEVFKDFQSTSSETSRKRKDQHFEEMKPEEEKRLKYEDPSGAAAAATAAAASAPEAESPGQLNAAMIKEMMANAQKMIKERKAQLNFAAVAAAPVANLVPPAQNLQADTVEKAKKAADLQARIAAQLRNAGLPQVATAPAEVATQSQRAGAEQGQQGPTPLILDDQGRTIDAKTGQAVQLALHTPTLKANIRAIRREQFRKELKERAPEDQSEAGFFDPRVFNKAAQRHRRSVFKFHTKGKFQQMGSKLRTKAQLEKLQNEIASVARKTGIASAARLATIQTKQSQVTDDVPQIEWWDSVILPPNGYEGLDQCLKEGFEGITNLVEHPTQMKPPADVTAKVTIPIMLTKKERKKLRRQNRMEVQKEQQEKIRLGLIAPPQPKVRLANLMRVLGTDAVQDPTKIEAHVRSQMAKRLKEHENRNAARKLSKEQRREKKVRKLQEDTSSGVHVAVYRLRDIRSATKKFKVETNAKQLFLTGIVVMHQECNVVVVEGGPRQQKKFKRLMMHRIKWNEDSKAGKDGDSGDGLKNTCSLVWQGEVKVRAFSEMKFKLCPTEAFAREQFKKAGVEHYWDTAFSGLVLESADNV